jgi:pimeloyl-ACP methyl ester carboxylesterase
MQKLRAILWLIFLLLNAGCLYGQNSEKKPAYNETEVVMDTSALSIYGTLTLPDTISGKIPVVLIIPGSGPTDRDGNNPYGLFTDCYKLLARQLALQNIATLRYDKRGVGKSAAALEEEKMLTVGVYVNDGEKWVQWLRNDKRFSKVIVLGHSEGALIGTLVSNFRRADGFISVSGSATRADSLIIQQLLKQAPELADTAKAIIEKINKGEPFYVNKDLAPIFRPSVSRYLKSWFSLSPTVEISLVRCPVIIIQGTHDLQVSVGEARQLAAARPGSNLEIIDQMNHVLKNSPAGFNENMATYKDPALPLSPELIPAITGFISRLK